MTIFRIFWLILFTVYICTLGGCGHNSECLHYYATEGNARYKDRDWVNITRFKSVGDIFEYNRPLLRNERPIIYIDIGSNRVPMDSKLIGPITGINDYFGYAILVDSITSAHTESLEKAVTEGRELLAENAVDHIYFGFPLDGTIDQKVLSAQIVQTLSMTCEPENSAEHLPNNYWPIVMLQRSKPPPLPPHANSSG